jgi:hypothetical protein
MSLDGFEGQLPKVTSKSRPYRMEGNDERNSVRLCEDIARMADVTHEEQERGCRYNEACTWLFKKSQNLRDKAKG